MKRKNHVARQPGTAVPLVSSRVTTRNHGVETTHEGGRQQGHGAVLTRRQVAGGPHSSRPQGDGRPGATRERH